MTKKLAAIILAILFCLGSLSLLSGCSGGSDKAIDADALYAALKKLEFKDELINMDMAAIENYYFFKDDSVIEKALVCKSASGATAEEIAVITVKDKKDVEAVKAAVEMRVDDLAFNFENYVPAEMKKINDAVIQTYGRYIVLAVVDDPAAAQSVIKEYCT